LLIFAYFAEGVVRVWAEPGTTRVLAGAEIALSVSFLCAAIAYVRRTRAIA